MRLAVLRLARMVIVLALAGAIVTFYLGGWLGPWLPGWVWSVIKMLVVTTAMLTSGRLVPRVREADLLAAGWKLGIPLALANIFLALPPSGLASWCFAPIQWCARHWRCCFRKPRSGRCFW